MGLKRPRMSMRSRGLILVGAALLVISIYFPWWGMKLIAAMYPEGLDLLVYPYKLEGQLDTINILNHYIGMREIHEGDFPEFQYIPYAVWGIAIGFAAAALTGSKGLGYVMFGLLAIGGIFGIYDMYHWLHTFGTQLDPQAPIQIDPFVPPVVGENQLANFTTYTGFKRGFYFLILGTVIVALGLWGDRLWNEKSSSAGSS